MFLRRVSLAVALFLAAIGAMAQDATTQAETSATCCRVRVVAVSSVAMPDARADITVAWLRSDDAALQYKTFTVTNGDPATDTDDKLWGTGANGQPVGLMLKVGSSIADETGPYPLRLNKAVLRWLVADGEIGAGEITIP